MDSTEAELQRLKAENAALKQELALLRRASSPSASPPVPHDSVLSPRSMQRYSRQMLLPDFGAAGQVRLLNTKVLVIGAGGIGSSAILYLAAAGVASLGIIDNDVVEESNLQRQVIHTEAGVGLPKAASARMAALSINSRLSCIAYNASFSLSNAMDICRLYDVIVDASDNVVTRYLANDVCAHLHRPLVSASALRWEGQLSVYNRGKGPCYRCVSPEPPPLETIGRCSDDGVIGAVAGTLGCLAALEAIKLGSASGEPLVGRLLLFDGLSGRCRTLQLRGADPQCCVCAPSVTTPHLVDMTMQCGPAHDRPGAPPPLASEHRVSASEGAARLRGAADAAVLLDVRSHVQLEIARLQPSNFLHVPLADLQDPQRLQQVRAAAEQSKQPVLVLCRRGIDSVAATQLLLQHGIAAQNIDGGLESWARTVDPSFPRY